MDIRTGCVHGVKQYMMGYVDELFSRYPTLSLTMRQFL